MKFSTIGIDNAIQRNPYILSRRQSTNERPAWTGVIRQYRMQSTRLYR